MRRGKLPPGERCPKRHGAHSDRVTPVRFGIEAAALGVLAACASQSAAGDSARREDPELWTAVERGEADGWRDRVVTVRGFADARAIGSVVLLRTPPRLDRDGIPYYDFDKCIGLMVSPQQYRLLRKGEWVEVSGRFSTVDVRPPDAVVTHLDVAGRRTYPSCSSRLGIAPFIYVGDVKFRGFPE